MSGSLKRVVSTVIVNVDGIEIGIIPNSLEYRDGKPTRDAKGLDNGDTLITESREEAVGMIKFDIPTTDENISLARTLENRKVSTVSFYDDNGTEISMSSGATKNDSNKAIGTDGKITLDYIGTPLD